MKFESIAMTPLNSTTLVVLLIASATLLSCRGQLSDKPPVQPQQNMFFQERFNAQQENPFFEDGMAMRAPVEGTVARGNLQADTEFYRGVDENGNFIDENPVTVTRELLERGRDRYDIYCSVCHGGTGDGQGIIMTGQYGYVPAPTFHQERTRDMTEGELYSAIADGIRTMPSYSHQLKPEDRWAVVAYIRALQESQFVPEDVMREYDVDLALLVEEYEREQERLAALEEAREAAAPDDDISAERGEELFTSQTCQACHSIDGTDMVGPSLLGVYGSERELDDGSTVTADEDYLYESLTEPGASVTAGYQNVMQPYTHLSEAELQSLIEFIKTLADND